MAEHQGPRRHAACQITVNGDDITSKLFPYLISVQVIDNLEGGLDECHIELDDRNGELAVPPDQAELTVALGWAGEGPHLPDLGRRSPMGGQGTMNITDWETGQEAKFGGPGMVVVFDGWVQNVESGFGRRGGGRRMWIEAKGGNDKGKIKEQQQGFLGEGQEDDSSGSSGQGKIPLKDMMSKVFGMAGLSVAMSPAMSKIARDYWSINDSPMNFGKRIAEETGGLFKISKRTAVLVGKVEGVNADGDAMATVDAIWGINLIGWRIKPYVSRPQYGQGAARHFDLGEGLWKTVKGAISGSTPHGGSDAIAHAVNSVVGKAEAEQNNKGAEGNVSSNRGTGWVLINGEPNAKANGFIRIEGARPGIDGTYTMTEVEHNYTRGVGYTTRMNVKNPNYAPGSFKWVQDGDQTQKGEKTTIAEDGSESWEPDPVEEWEARQERERQKKLKEIEEMGESWDPATEDPGESWTPDPIEEQQAREAREREAARKAEEEAGESWSPEDEPPPPPMIGPPAPPPPPQSLTQGPIAGERVYTAKELEEIRQIGTPLPPQEMRSSTPVTPPPLGSYGERSISGQELYAGPK